MRKSNKKNICVVTGSRAEYGQLYWVLKEIEKFKNLNLQLIVTGTHLSEEFGSTCKEIIHDGFKINNKTELILSSDSPSAISKSVGIGLISFAEVLKELKPDMCLVLGDRYEIFSFVTTAFIFGIPIAHIAGGEITDGVIDDGFRHSISKMSDLHFTSNPIYSKRLIQMGECSSRVFSYGMPGLDSIYKTKLLNRIDFENSIKFKLNKRNFLITFHPLSKKNSTKDFDEILKSLKYFDDTNFIFTYPNSDTYGRKIIDKIKLFNKDYPVRSIVFKSMGSLNYLSALKYVDLVIGNSSSGITEAPCFKTPTINIGIRQNGRLKSESIIDVIPERNKILQAIKKGLNINERGLLSKVNNPYGKGGASSKIVSKINDFLKKPIKTKSFIDSKT